MRPAYTQAQPRTHAAIDTHHDLSEYAAPQEANVRCFSTRYANVLLREGVDVALEELPLACAHRRCRSPFRLRGEVGGVHELSDEAVTLGLQGAPASAVVPAAEVEARRCC
jgi:hypothetical protein